MKEEEVKKILKEALWMAYCSGRANNKYIPEEVLPDLMKRCQLLEPQPDSSRLLTDRKIQEIQKQFIRFFGEKTDIDEGKAICRNKATLTDSICKAQEQQKAKEQAEALEKIKDKMDAVVAGILRDVSGVDAYRYYTDEIIGLVKEALGEKKPQLIMECCGQPESECKCDEL